VSTRSEPWRVDAVPEFTAWLSGLDQDGQEKVEPLIRLLERFGPTLGRPYADRLKGSKHHNLKELWPSSSQDEARLKEQAAKAVRQGSRTTDKTRRKGKKR
jgi:hypothetical protein